MNLGPNHEPGVKNSRSPVASCLLPDKLTLLPSPDTMSLQTKKRKISDLTATDFDLITSTLCGLDEDASGIVEKLERLRTKHGKTVRETIVTRPASAQSIIYSIRRLLTPPL